jgi:hypothetical protein
MCEDHALIPNGLCHAVFCYKRLYVSLILQKKVLGIFVVSQDIVGYQQQSEADRYL